MKEVKKSQSEYIKNNFNNQTPKELSENTGLTVGQVKSIIKDQEDKSIEDIIREHDEDVKVKKAKKIVKYGVSQDGNSVVMTPSQSSLDDKLRDALENKNNFLKKYSKDIGIIGPKEE